VLGRVLVGLAPIDVVQEAGQAPQVGITAGGTGVLTDHGLDRGRMLQAVGLADALLQ
jgi:hypothetical protein